MTAVIHLTRFHLPKNHESNLLISGESIESIETLTNPVLVGVDLIHGNGMYQVTIGSTMN